MRWDEGMEDEQEVGITMRHEDRGRAALSPKGSNEGTMIASPRETTSGSDAEGMNNNSSNKGKQRSGKFVFGPTSKVDETGSRGSGRSLRSQRSGGDDGGTTPRGDDGDVEKGGGGYDHPDIVRARDWDVQVSAMKRSKHKTFSVGMGLVKRRRRIRIELLRKKASDGGDFVGTMMTRSPLSDGGAASSGRRTRVRSPKGGGDANTITGQTIASHTMMAIDVELAGGKGAGESPPIAHGRGDNEHWDDLYRDGDDVVLRILKAKTRLKDGGSAFLSGEDKGDDSSSSVDSISTHGRRRSFTKP